MSAEIAEKDFLCKLFSEMNSSGISYYVMRNYQTLPYSAGGSDLDILVGEKYGEQTLFIIESVIASTCAAALGVSSAPGFFKIYILGRNSSVEQPWWGLRIDVNIGLFYKGLRLLSQTQKMRIESHNDIKVLSEGLAGVLGVLKEVLNNGKIPQRYLVSAQLGVNTEWDAISRLLSPMGKDCLAEIEEAILEVPSDQARASRAIRRHLFRHARATNPCKYIRGRAASLFSRLRRYCQPSGTVIAILGPDGAGKSTLINAIKPALDQATHNATVVNHLRPDFLPPLAAFKHGVKSSSGPVTVPHGSPPSGVLGSLLRVCYAMLNYVLGYWFETRVQIAKQPTIVIYDRYAYDMAIDPARFRIALPQAVVRFFTRLAPKPDLVFCLVGSPEVLFERKQELPMEEVTRQVEALKNFATGETRAMLIDTEQSIETCRDNVLQAISDYCREHR